MTSEPDLFAEFESIGEILGFVLHSEGPEALRQLLKVSDLDADTLHQAAEEMRVAGMVEGAEIVAGVSARADTRSARLIASTMDDPVNQPGYLAYRYRRGEVTVDDMVTAGVPADVIAYVGKARR